MATYEEIQDWVKRKYGFVPQSCWIGHCKQLNGLPLKRKPPKHRKKPCPKNKRSNIEDAFRHFKWI